MSDHATHAVSRRHEAKRVTSPAGVAVAYHAYGSGPPLVLVHGSFTDHITNWQYVEPLLAREFSVRAVARRGRGETDATEGHGIEDEGRDVAAVIKKIGEQVFLLGHSYGAHVALAAASEVPDRVRRLVLYEPPWPDVLDADVLARLEVLARAGDWDGFAVAFHREVLSVPDEELDDLRASDFWPPIVANSPTSLDDLRAVSRHTFDAERFRKLRMPVTLQIGSESPRELFVTDALAGLLPDVRVEELPGQAHEGMIAGPEQYAQAVSRSLLS